MNFEIGKTLETGMQFCLKIKDVVASRTYIASETRFGKSHLARKIVEECFGQVGIIIIDPEGEYASLREREEYPFLIIGRDVPIEVETETLKAATAEFMAQQVLENKISVIIDLSLIEDVESGKEYVDAFLRRFFHLQTTAKQPYLIIWEEAEEYAPESGSPGTRTCLEIAATYARRGGKRGIGIIFVGHRPAWISKGILSQCPNKAIGRIESTDMKALEDYARIPKSIVEKLVPKSNEKGETIYAGPGRGEFCFTGDWVEKTTFVKVGPVKTTHLGASPEIVPFAPKKMQSVIETLQKNLKQTMETIKPAVASTAELESRIRNEFKTKYEDEIKSIRKTAYEKAERTFKVEIERLKTLNDSLSRSQALQPTAPIADVLEHPIVKTRMSELPDKTRDLLIKLEREAGKKEDLGLTRELLAAFLTTSTNSVADMVARINTVFHATVIITEGKKPLRYKSMLKRLYLTDVGKREIEEMQRLQDKVHSLEETNKQLLGEKQKRLQLEQDLKDFPKLKEDVVKLQETADARGHRVKELGEQITRLENELGPLRKLKEDLLAIGVATPTQPAIVQHTWDEAKVKDIAQQAVKELLGPTMMISIDEKKIVEIVEQKLKGFHVSKEIIAEVLRQLPTTTGAIVYQVLPIEKLQKDFQEDAKAKILADVAGLDPEEKKVVKFMEIIGKNTTIKEIMEKGLLLNPNSGGSRDRINTKLTNLITLELIRKDAGGRIFSNLKPKITKHLDPFNAKPEEIEQVYSHILMELSK